MSSSAPSAPMVTTLMQLREALDAARLPLELPAAAEARKLRDQMVSQLEDYVLPRLIQIDAPLLTVVGGSTGAGKSTLVNSLVGERVSEAGVLRPTTRSPVLVHHPRDADWFDKSRILPDFQRTSRTSADPGALQLVASEAVPEGLALLDAPDVDSVERQNRELAAQLLAAADMWLFVTSAARYADQVPWDFLRQAADRSAAVAVVLDRTVPSAIEEVSVHLTRMLDARGLRDSPLLTIPETELDGQGLLPPACVEKIQVWLEDLAADTDARAGIVRQTLGGAIRTIADRTHVVADACGEQEAAVAGLFEEIDRVYQHAALDLDRACGDGTLLSGDLLSSWQEFAGSGELLKSLESKVNWARERLVNVVRGQPRNAARVSTAVESGLRTLILEHAEAAAGQADAAWRASAPGRALLDASDADLSRASGDLRARVERAVSDWQRGVQEMVRSEGADRRTSAHFLAYGMNGLAAALMLVAFASGDSGRGTGAAAGSVATAQRLLEAAFGDDAVRRLTARAHEDLGRRIGVLLEREQHRYYALVDDTGIGTDGADRMRRFARRIDDLRYRQVAS